MARHVIAKANNVEQWALVKNIEKYPQMSVLEIGGIALGAVSMLQGLTLLIARMFGRDREFAANIYCVILYSVLIFGMMACAGVVIWRLLQ